VPVERRVRAGLKKNGQPRGPDKRFGLSRRARRIVYIAAGVIGGIILIMASVVVYAAFTLPNINDIGQATGAIKILDRNGTLIAEVGHDQQTRNNVSIGQIAPVMQQATLAAEDRNFYSEGAFDLKRVVKAVIDDIILRRPAEGASTITQQLVKQAFFGQAASKDPLRKIREALLAQEIDSKDTKQQILNQYLNITYYGENAYGIEDASQRYFGKHAAQLSAGEAALLAGLPQAPSYNDPFKNPKAAYARMDYVLSGLVAMGQITQAQSDAVDPLVGDPNPTPAQVAQQQKNQQAIQQDLLGGQNHVTAGPAPHFVQYIEDQLQQQFADDPSFLDGNLTVTTTLDLNIQKKANAAVHQGVANLGRGANNGALLMIAPRTGQILAMVGSADYTNDSIAGQFNVVTAERRPGSSFKPYVYEEGFKTGALKPDTVLQDTRKESQALGGVQDFDRNYLGSITAARALLLSRNVATEQAMVKTGVTNVVNFAHQLGITSPLAENASTGIGSSAVKMIDHASAYAAFANGGQKVTAYGILKVVDDKGSVLADNTQPPGQEHVMTQAEAWTITNILRGYSRYWHIGIKWDTAGKSGTTDNFVDAWYMAYTPDWVVATWAGHTNGSNPAEVGMNDVFGTTEAQYIAVPFVNSLPRPSPFTPASGLTDCASQDASAVSRSGCPTPTSTPTPSPSATATPTPLPTLSPSPMPTPVISPSGLPGPTQAPASPAAAANRGASPAQPASNRAPP